MALPAKTAPLEHRILP